MTETRFPNGINGGKNTDLEIWSDSDIALYPQGHIWISQGTKLIFEGTTPDDWEVKLQATTITADRDIVLPDASGTIAVSVSDTTTTTQGSLNLDFTLSATGNISATGTVYDISTSSSPIFAGLTINGSSIVFEGSSEDANETTLTVTNPTADRTITFPNATGTVAVSVSDTTTTTQGSLNLDFTLSAAGNISATGTVYDISTSSSPIFAGLTINGSSIVFEGSSEDANETTLTVTNPTADNTITFPDATGTVAVSVSDTTASTQGDLSLDFTLSAAGNISATGTTYGMSSASSPIFAGLTINGSSIVFEGSSEDANETTLTVTNPTADNTITFPDATGTVAVSVSDTTASTQGDLSLDFTLSAAGNISATGTTYGMSSASSPIFARIVVNSIPATSVGVAGDTLGMIASNGAYLYICTADYTDGLSDIWSRTAVTASTW